jgi:hypothetical protein
LARKKAEAKCVKFVLIKEGTYDLEENVLITCPVSIHGAGQNKTILQRHGIKIRGTQEEKKRVEMQGMTMKGSSGRGLSAENGLSFLCKDMTFTQCGVNGVWASNKKGRLINCVITQCRWSGISCWANALIELEGDQTKVDGNGTSGYGGCYGLSTYDTSSIIHLLFPLTKESVSTNTTGGYNYNSSGTIQTVKSFDNNRSTTTTTQ